MELRGHRRANKPQSGLFSRHYFNGRVVSLSGRNVWAARTERSQMSKSSANRTGVRSVIPQVSGKPIPLAQTLSSR